MIQPNTGHLYVTAKSHPGLSGKNNEDRYVISAFTTGANRVDSSVLAIVSDGIGGHRAGEVAAEIAVKTINQAVMAGEAEQPLHALQNAVILASQAIYKQSEIDPEQKGMGATCACCWIINDRLYTVCVGDSRVYLTRGKSIRKLSTDHTWIQEAIDNGVMTPDQAQGHPNAHVIRRFLGSRQTVVPDLRLRLHDGESDAQAEANQGLQLEPGDQVLLCSDGLTDLVTEDEIQEILTVKPPEDAADELINLANQRGGHDNITVAILMIPDRVTQAAPVNPQPRRPNRLKWACLSAAGLLLVVILLVLAAVLWYLYQPIPAATPTAAPPTGALLHFALRI